MAIAGSFRLGSDGRAPGSDEEFRRIFELIAPAYRRALPAPHIDGALRVQQVSAPEPAFADPGEPVACWLEGRVFNLDALRRAHGLADARGAPELLARALARGGQRGLEAVLRDADGDFFAALHSRAEGRGGTLRLCSDRLGLKPVYFLAEASRLFFCCRLRGALALRDFSPAIDRGAIESFLDLGHLLGNRTWFEGVELLPPATVLAFDLAAGTRAASRHWRWSEIAPLAAPPSLDEAAAEFARLLRAAVDRRVLPGERPAVLLSGGLDSRALLGCLPPELCGGTATMGQARCRDLDYAARVARAAGVPHRVLPLSEKNWDLNRFHALWKCDGMSSPADLSSSQFSREMRALGTVNLNGFAGDLVAGGSYLQEGFLDASAGEAFAAKQYGRHARAIPGGPGADDHSSAPHTDPYVLAQRVRRMTVSGTLEAEDASEQRKPFMDNALLEFLYALPDGMRRHGALYRRALLRMRPDLFAEIPWQKTGLPLDAEDTAWGRARIKAIRAAQRLKLSARPAGFQDLPAWLRASREKYAALLGAPDALWRDFAPEAYRERFDFDARLDRDPYRLFHAVGVEAWLRQVLRGELREPEIPEPDSPG
jgi:asparagine synthase (glutamine-hydrolysing)